MRDNQGDFDHAAEITRRGNMTQAERAEEDRLADLVWELQHGHEKETPRHWPAIEPHELGG